MTKKICFVLIVVLLFALPAITQEPNTAAAQLTTDTPHFQSGDEVSFTMKLNEPLPEGARFDVRLSPVSVNQEIRPISNTNPYINQWLHLGSRSRLSRRTVSS